MDHDIITPVMDRWFLSWGQHLLYPNLPALDPSSPYFVSGGLGSTTSTTAPSALAGLNSHVVALMTDLVRVQCDAWDDAIAARASAAAPKTVSNYFKTHNTA